MWILALGKQQHTLVTNSKWILHPGRLEEATHCVDNLSTDSWKHAVLSGTLCYQSCCLEWPEITPMNSKSRKNNILFYSMKVSKAFYKPWMVVLARYLQVVETSPHLDYFSMRTKHYAFHDRNWNNSPSSIWLASLGKNVVLMLNIDLCFRQVLHWENEHSQITAGKFKFILLNLCIISTSTTMTQCW